MDPTFLFIFTGFLVGILVGFFYKYGALILLRKEVSQLQDTLTALRHLNSFINHNLGKNIEEYNYNTSSEDEKTVVGFNGYNVGTIQ